MSAPRSVETGLMPDTTFARAAATAVCALVFVCSSVAVSATTSVPIALTVDVSDAPVTSVVHVRETIPVAPGVVDLAYPRWVPGEHQASGPIQNVGGLTVSAGSTQLAWTRDPLDVNEFHITVPDGVNAIDVAFDYLGSKDGTYSEARLATKTIVAVNWNQFLLYPQHAKIGEVEFAPTLVLPGADWTAETALPGPVRTGNTVAYAPATLERLVDSPLDAGSVFKRFTLLNSGGFTNEIDAFADRPSQLVLDPKALANFKHIPLEMDAIYGARHWTHYHFLLTVSDAMPGNGVEHTSSSDDGSRGDALTDPDALRGTSGLLSHEFNHSWDGKYRRPADLATTNFQVPEGTDYLWIYEGMTQLYGDLVPVRAGFTTPEQFREQMVGTYAREDAEPGRLVRSLYDTSAAAPFLYDAPRSLAPERRTAGDFYAEGELLWLDVDAELGALSGGTKSLDGFCKRFFGIKNTPPEVDPYTYAQFLAALNAYAPHDWAGFFQTTVFEPTPHPPNPFALLGWRVVYKGTPTANAIKMSKRFPSFDASSSLGVSGNDKGAISNVAVGTPAARAGMGQGDQIVAVDDREFTPDVLDQELTGAVENRAPLRFLLKREGVFRTTTIDYHGGPRYPRLVRIPGTPDKLAAILAPHRAGAVTTKAAR